MAKRSELAHFQRIRSLLNPEMIGEFGSPVITKRLKAFG